MGEQELVSDQYGRRWRSRNLHPETCLQILKLENFAGVVG
jgi:hypothetical protein